MDEEQKWEYILKLDEELLLGGVIVSEWSAFLIRDADIAFCKGAYLATIFCCTAGIETHLRYEYQNDDLQNRLGLYNLIENSPIDNPLKKGLHDLRKYRNRWVHVNNPEYDQKLLENPSQVDRELENVAIEAIKLLRQVVYLEQFV